MKKFQGKTVVTPAISIHKLILTFELFKKENIPAWLAFLVGVESSVMLTKYFSRVEFLRDSKK